ncbi:propionyl-CoA synthetase [Notoacmeibacter marinus]|uniref:Propionyl-CoA synthetase n=1 Tax=Notoacmeibacter marinus TaxID=1876515 RepID=A0A231V302_9HYPH|nr:propionyl-CoA synthetase [Notoacmeibacter marinus]OXT02563.1 propionyl-CoA synthetase [Notoacmeibacter marinus]
MMSDYESVYAQWQAGPETFWEEQAEAIDWMKPADKIFDAEAGVYGRWFAGAECNTCANAVDRHVEAGHGDRLAIIYDSPITGTKSQITYSELLKQVNALACVLSDKGVTKGDRVVLYMPMIPQTAIAMLACARLGAIHSVVFGGFAAKELATRINDAKPKMVIAASCGLEPSRIVEYKPLLDKAIEMADTPPETCVIFQRPQAEASMVEGRDIDWADAVSAAEGRTVEPTAVAATDPLYVLYTSGTTGQPKGVIRDNGGHMVALEWTMKNFYGIDPGDVLFTASDFGWVVGHSYIVYGPLLRGATTIIFEGKPVGTPDPGVFWRIVEEYGVKAIFTAPTAFRAIRQQDPEGEFIKKYDLSSFQTLFLAGERADPETIKWAERQLNVPVIDHWWQTETGWVMCGNPAGLGLLPVKYGSPTKPMPGYDIQILTDEGEPVTEPNVLGNVVVKLPLPPGALPTLWNADQRFRDAYLEEYPGYYKTADAGKIDEDGYLFVMARTDDIINVAGHRLSTGAMEEVLAEHPDVAEAAVIGIADPMKGQVPLGFVVLSNGVDRPESELEKEIVAMVRDRIGAVAAFRQLVCVKRLPKTRSGKILRATMQKIADKEDSPVPATIDDPAILEEVSAVLERRGFLSRPLEAKE